MSSSEVQKDDDDSNVPEDQNGEDRDLVAVLRENEELLEEDEDDDSDDDDDETDDDDEETGDDEEEAEDEITENADNGDEGVSEEDDSEDDDEADENEDSDEGEEEEQEEEAENADSSSGDENCDRCPICLNRLQKQDIGTPESCDHCFCLECIQAWAKNVNTCPVDRQVFRIILAKHAGEEKIFKQFPVEDRQQENEEAEEDPTYCEVCGQSNREDRLLLCDRCDLGYHCDCLTPPLASVPVHEWFCPDCQQSRNTVESELQPSGRQIARTRISERVRRLIAEARAERAERRRRVAAMIVAQEALEEEEQALRPSTSAATASLATTEKIKTPRKRKTVRKKVTRKKKTTKRKTKKKAGKKTRRKRKSKGKRKRKVKRIKKKSVSSITSPGLARTAISRAVTSVKGRIADKLGLSKPPAGRSIPMQKLSQSSTRQEGSARSSVDHGASSFSILGSKDELYLFADLEGEERQPVSRPAIPAETLLSRSAKSSHKPLSFSPAKKTIVVKDAPTTSSLTSVATGGFDLLGSILQNQDILHKGSKHVIINRDGSLSATNVSTASSSGKTTASVKVNALETSKSDSQLSSTSRITQNSLAVPASEKNSVDNTSSSKLLLSKTVSFNNVSACSDTTVKLETGNDVHKSLINSSKRQSDAAPDVVKFSDATSSDEELVTVKTEDEYIPASVQIDDLDNSDCSISLDKANASLSEVKLDSSCIEGTQNFSAVKSEVESEFSSVDNIDCGIKQENDFNDDVYSNSKSSSDNAELNNGAEIRESFLDTSMAEHQSKPLPGSESSSVDHNSSSNNSPATGSRESNSLLTTNVNGSPRLHTGDLNSGVDLEADAVFSNNARLNAEEDAGNNSIGFSAAANSQANLRNFAAVASDLSNVHDDSSVSIMKRNFNLLVSTSANLAGYESSEENDNIERYIHHPNDREEGEASDSSKEGEARENEGRQREDDQEEGEIVDDEERNRWMIGRNTCGDEDHEDSGGLDVNAIHIEEMEIGTFRKRSMSQNEDNNEGCKKVKQGEENTNDTETKEESQQEEESDEEDVGNTGKLGYRSFMLSSLLSSLKTDEPDATKDNDQKKDDEADERRKQEEKEDLTMKPISILDFIGDASAKKFGLQTVERDRGRGDQSFGQFRGSTSFGYRDSRSNGDRRRNHWQRDRRASDAEVGHEDMEDVPPRPFDRRRGPRQEENRDRQRSGSRDSRGVSQGSGSHERWSLKNHNGRDGEKRRRDEESRDGEKRKRDEESRDRSGKSRSHSGSPRRKGEKRRRDIDQEERSRYTRKGKRSRWNNEDDEPDEDEKDVEKPSKESEKKKENSDLSKVQANGYPTAVVHEKHPQTSGHYQSHQYPPGVAAYPYQGASIPPPPCSHPNVQSHPSHPHIQTHTHSHATHPALPFGHSASLGQPPYSQPIQQMAQTGPLHAETKSQYHHGYPTSYYPQSLPMNVNTRAPPPPPHPYPHVGYRGPVRYPPQPGQSATNLIHTNLHIAATGQPHSSYPRHPQAGAHPYSQSVPHATYQPRPLTPSTALVTAVPAYPPPQPPSTSVTPTMPPYRYPAVSGKQETSASNSAAAVKQELSTSAPPPSSVRPEHQKLKETIKESSPKDMKPARTSYHNSPPTAPIKGVTTYDKVDSSILLNEVKKGFRQLVEDAVRCALKGAWSAKKITKEEYKDIFKRSVEKVCGSKETVVHQEKIQSLVNAYVMKARKTRKTEPA